MRPLEGELMVVFRCARTASCIFGPMATSIEAKRHAGNELCNNRAIHVYADAEEIMIMLIWPILIK